MIHRAFLLFVALVLLPDVSIYLRYLVRSSRWVKGLWCAQALVMLACICWLASVPDFSPRPQQLLNIFLFVTGVYLVPKFLFVFCAAVGRLLRKPFPTKHNWGAVVGLLLAAAAVFVTVYGSTVGFNKLEVRRVDYSSPRLPESFEGYRIALFSDAHVGSYTGESRHVLADAVDSILSLKPDVIFFLGDIQNTWADEVEEHLPTLSRLKAPDGVFSVMGNHDYSKYISGTLEEKLAAEEKTKNYQRGMGWRLLLNENTILRHGGDSIVLAGMEGNEEIGVDRGVANHPNTVRGMPEGVFTIMLAHNPNLWRHYVVPYIDAPLTLSGHTHGGQIRLFGVSTTTFTFHEDRGMYEMDGKSLYVTAGLGALIPLRFNVPGEVVLLTLHHQPQSNEQP